MKPKIIFTEKSLSFILKALNLEVIDNHIQWGDKAIHIDDILGFKGDAVLTKYGPVV